MQEKQFHNNALPECLRQIPIKTTTCLLNEIYQKHFLYGLQNARNILADLERSIKKSSSYEDKLLQCKARHRHSHDFNDWPWDRDFSDEKEKDLKSAKHIGNDKSVQLQNPINLLESWSTMSIVCLQYQYEELSKRYKTLLKAFNENCTIISAKNSTLVHMHLRARVMHARLAAAHRTLLCMGEKYLALKKKKTDQLQQYDKKIEFFKGRVQEVLTTAETARLHLDQKLASTMSLTRDSEYAMLLAEMRKCNQLYLENLKLKAQLEEYMPGSVLWN